MGTGHMTPLQSTMATIAGSSLLWCWGFLCYLSPAMFPFSSTTGSIGIENAFFTSQLVAALFGLSIFLITRNRQLIIRPHWFLVAALAVSAGALVVEATLWGFVPLWGLYLAGAVDGIAVPLLGVAWGTRYSLGTSGNMRTGSLVILSFLFAYLIYFVLAWLPYPIGTIATCLIPLVSWLLWRSDTRSRHETGNDVLPSASDLRSDAVDSFPGEISAGDRDARILPWKAMSLIAFAALTANFVCSYIMGWSYDAVDMVTGGVIVVAGITTMAYVMSVLDEDVEVENVYRFSLPFTVIGLLAILVLGTRGVTVGGSLVNGCGMFMQSLVMFEVAESTQRYGISPLLSFSVGQALVSAMVFAGNVGGKLVVYAVGFDPFTLDLFCAMGVVVLFFMLLYLHHSPMGGTAGSSTASTSVTIMRDGDAEVRDDTGGKDARSENLDALGKAAGLTARETEVFELLARGRSLPFIADRLFVTTGTVKTHTMHIYRKLGIDNRQELLDLVDAGSLPQAPTMYNGR